MKIKSDFITNSSSTAFFFFFKGEKIQDLSNVLRKYDNVFERDEFEYKMNVEDLVSSIENLVPSVLQIKDIDKLVPQFLENIQRLIETCYKENKEGDKFDSAKYFMGDVRDRLKTYEISKDILKKGFTKVLEIEFGDNDGHVAGGNVGTLMDYKHSSLEMKKEDLVILTESRH